MCDSCKHGCMSSGHGHGHNHSRAANRYWRPAVSFLMLVCGMGMSLFGAAWFDGIVLPVWYLAAFLPVGLPVVAEAVTAVRQRDFFNEFTLMTVACVGAFFIGEYPEAVGVMLFYTIGESLQDGAVDRATRNISRLVDSRPDRVVVKRDGGSVAVPAESVAVGEVIEVMPGGRVPLDGMLMGAEASFDTSALTGEGVPRNIDAGGEVLAGMMPVAQAVQLRVVREYADSALARVLEMVRDASARKAPAERFISKFARVYTPVVALMALLIVAVPTLVGLCLPSFEYVFSQWLYRGLVFLVISCPCALVISVPLGYYAGIGAASRAGILFKGGNYIEAITRIDAVAFDKTGTLTTGKFEVTDVVAAAGTSELELLQLMGAAESKSLHPVARAVVDFVRGKGVGVEEPRRVSERAGYGVCSEIGGRMVSVGSVRMMAHDGVAVPDSALLAGGTVVACCADGVFAGYMVIADELKPDAVAAVDGLRELGFADVSLLSGDRNVAVARCAASLGILDFHGELLPADKVALVTGVAGRRVAFVGDGINDAPVLAVSDVGIAMGALGSDAAIESADVVIRSDSPAKVVTAISIARYTKRLVMMNIVGAIAIKVAILLLGAAGCASLWGAVFADVGVALLAVANSMRVLWKRF